MINQMMTMIEDLTGCSRCVEIDCLIIDLSKEKATYDFPKPVLCFIPLNKSKLNSVN